MHLAFILGTGKHSYLKEFLGFFSALVRFPGVKEEQFEYLCIPSSTDPFQLRALASQVDVVKRF